MTRRYLFLFLFSLVLSASGLASLPVVDRDEARFVQATKQMAESGDYLDIRFQEASRYKKPIGIYWLQSAAVALSGEGADAPIWIYRLVSALGIAIAAVATAWTATVLFGANAGMAAGLVVAAIFATAFEGRIAKTDAFLLACCVLAQGALAQIYVASRRNEQSAAYLPWLFWIAQGLGILIKGLISPALSLLTILVLLAFERDARWLSRLKAGRGLLLTALIVVPWLAVITWKSGGAFWQEAVGKDLVGKVADGQESHGMPPGYYSLTYSLFMWPFSLIAIGAGLAALNHMRGDPRLRFCLAWYIPFWILLELVPTKLPHYVLPAYPAVALLVGWLLTLSPEQAALKRWQTWLYWATAFGLVVVTLGIAAIAVGAPLYLTGAFNPWSIPAAIFALAAGYLAFPRQSQLSLNRVGAAAAAAGAAYALLIGLIVPTLTPIWLTPRIVAAIQEKKPCENSVLASSQYHEPSLIFMAGTKTKLTDTQGAADHLATDPNCALALVPVADEAALQSALAGSGKTATRLTEINGTNYSSGDKLALGLYRVANP
ncbi:glycosyltransferase family 39 protein [Mesorhizobium sp. 1M-11]|uniref:ArnT family glycosyltransferase n=1 Tax=Mesorhizobium sp. 1M-11 TaxID=1529006 RepID=UPI000AC03EDF|nr:glycosyltransferase family 39 protein [Mesorhizobium sp. 1M-11]